MAVVIKVLNSNTKKPIKGVRVSYSSNRGFGSEKFTGDDGCVSYIVDPISAVVTIRGDRKSEQYLQKGENVFYIWVVTHFSIGKSEARLRASFFMVMICDEKVLEKVRKIIEWSELYNKPPCSNKHSAI